MSSLKIKSYEPYDVESIESRGQVVAELLKCSVADPKAS